MKITFSLKLDACNVLEIIEFNIMGAGVLRKMDTQCAAPVPKLCGIDEK